MNCIAGGITLMIKTHKEMYQNTLKIYEASVKKKEIEIEIQ